MYDVLLFGNALNNSLKHSIAKNIAKSHFCIIILLETKFYTVCCDQIHQNIPISVKKGVIVEHHGSDRISI